MSPVLADLFAVTAKVLLQALLATSIAFVSSAHGRVFMVLEIMQYFWYSSDKRRERFVKMCEDKDVQELTWQAYMNKELVRKKPMAHVRIFFKDLAHLFSSFSPQAARSRSIALKQSAG